MFYLAISCCFRNEHKSLPEWLDYHIMMGVEHFYLFDHRSKDRNILKTILEPYKEHITYQEWNYKSYKDAHWKQIDYTYDQLRDKAKWIVCNDVDEYIYPLKESSIVPVVEKYDKEDVGVLRLNSMYFGIQPYESLPDPPITQKLFMRQKEVCDPWGGHATKGIFKGSHIHCFDLHPKAFGERKKRLERAYKNLVHIDPQEMRLNHYYSRTHGTSKECRRRYKNRTQDQYNEIEDNGMLRFV